MANQKKPAAAVVQTQSPVNVLAVGAVCLVVGLAVGYYFGKQSAGAPVTGGEAAQLQGSGAGSQASLVDPAVLQQNEARLKSSLAANPGGLPFNELKDLCALTDGNLSRHLQQLEEAGLVEIQKGFEKKRPRTTVTITAAGKSRFAEYLNVLESVVADALEATRAAKRGRTREGHLPI